MRSARSSSKAGTVDRTRVADQVLRDLKRDILRGSLLQGAKLPAERELAKRYGVSGPTVREAIRALSTLGFVDVRHGSGAYVTADTALLVATALSATIQLGNLSCFDVLSVLGTLYRQAAMEAVATATEDDFKKLAASMVRIDGAKAVEEAADALREFHAVVVGSAHNALLSALCRFLIELQTELAVELAENSMDVWRSVFDAIRPARTRLFEALTQRHSTTVIACVEEFYRIAVDVVMSLPRAREVRLTDPRFRKLLAEMLERVEPN